MIIQEHMRPEHPRPQLERDAWLNLNGEWAFEIDHGDTGRARGLVEGPLSQRINVPFCPESRLSGVGYTDFMAAVWYRRTFTLPENWAGERVFLHFGAVDYTCEAWVDGVSVGVHRGGYSSFSFEITCALQNNDTHTVTVCAQDDTRSGQQPAGKQSNRYDSYGCSYTRTTGIWQTVWLECRPQAHIAGMKMIPDPENKRVHIRCKVDMGTALPWGTVQAAATYEGKPMGSAEAQLSGDTAVIVLDVAEVYLWEVGAGRLYDLELAFGKDRVHSYFGLRTVNIAGEAIHINHKPVFQRLVLDQGFNPDGVITAPSDDELRMDIQRSLDCGFNGARLHQKVFEERFLYWADRMGYLVWGEMANWGLDISTPQGLTRFLPEWLECVARDFNHPSLVGWCPFNETQRNQNPEVLRQTYMVTKAMDPTRPVIDTSGWLHTITDIYDIHDYDQDPDSFTRKYGPGVDFDQFHEPFPGQKHKGEPFFVSEYGGIWWNPQEAENSDAWGYGGKESRPRTPVEFLERFEGLTRALLMNPHVCALCYTQLTDVEQEVNGLYTYGREAKFDNKILKGILGKKAAIEE